ncbi:Transmembrane emp24 domain-containing protein 5 [Desmophyllum pertusum]|uniref:Transmembrane emp24 domain-containing protein 5 n=1 Tax=Desmophyllum pertusum TaxID=174260 RepID=A0A9W9ZEK6_9CNID|nr:Transmembrane emp24 domain-containing protein 5 [Desmophyllum pertusum]
MRWPLTLGIFLQWLILLPVSRAMLNGFTTVVEAGKMNCFYENIDGNKSLEIEYQVVEGGGELDIIFQVVAPSGDVLVSDVKKTDEVHTVQAAESGVYAFCFDNTFSTLAEKVVFADLGLENDDIDSWLTMLQGDTGLEEKELQVQSIRNTLDNIKVLLEKAQHYQSYLTKKNFKSQFLVARSGRRVFWWSLIQSVALIGVAICQVLIVKNFFGTDSSGQKI